MLHHPFRTSAARCLAPAALALSLAFTSCASTNIAKGPAQVDDLVGWIERVYVETELARERMRTAVTELESLVGTSYDEDAVTAYTSFVEALRQSEAQAKRLGEQVDPMKKAAEPVFARWEESLDQFQSERMRARSEARLTSTKERYAAILAAVDPAQEKFETINAALRDHALFLGNDFNQAALGDVREDAREVIELAGKLDVDFETSLKTTRAYVEAASLPLTSATAAPAPGGPGASTTRFRRR